MLEQLINLIAPHYCLECGTPGRLLCEQCADSRLIKAVSRCYRCGKSTEQFRTCRPCRAGSELFQVWSACAYDGVAKDLVRRLKFERARAAADVMADRLAAVLPADANWLVTHLPTANNRVRQRGYDQAQLIAKRLGKVVGLPCPVLLVRQGSSRQLGQTRQTRFEQMSVAFRPERMGKTEGRHILLVDDVLTTGASLEAAAKTLKAAGAKRVSAAVFAAV